MRPFTASRHCFCDDLSFSCITLDDLEKAIAVVRNWSLRMRMQINEAKSGILAIRVDGRTPQVKKRTVGDIPVVTSYKYLGLEINDCEKYKRLLD